MEEIMKFIPYDKSWIIRMGILDLTNSCKDIEYFLDDQNKLNEDLIALKRVVKEWDTDKLLDVGESGTLYRFVRFALWKQGSNRKITKKGTLKSRNICNNKEIINWSIEKLLTLDNGTSQWASASVLMGNKERPENVTYKLKLTYESVNHWNSQRKKELCWIPKKDETIKKQALSYINLIKTGKINFAPEHSEDYCFARAFDLITPEEGERKFPSLRYHETDRISEMEKTIQQADNNILINSKDHRVVQAIVIRQKYRNKKFKILNEKSVNKSWPLFWEFIKYCSKNFPKH